MAVVKDWAAEGKIFTPTLGVINVCSGLVRLTTFVLPYALLDSF